MIHLQVHHCSILKQTTLFTMLTKYIFIYLCYKQSINTEVAGLSEKNASHNTYLVSSFMWKDFYFSLVSVQFFMKL